MAELITVARPYAKAAFQYALAANALPQWSQMLALAAVVASDESMSKYLDNPRLTAETKAKAIVDVCGDELDESGKSFIAQVALNKRLSSLTEIYALYEVYLADQEKLVDVSVQSAFELGDSEIEKIATSLELRLGRKVQMEVSVDRSLVGGLVIRAGDMVIDGSIRGKLDKLANILNS